jgi:ParB family chromosome partitioning protein
MRPTEKLPADDQDEAVVQLALERIVPNPLQPRRRFPADQLRQLAETIKGQGVIQPIVVRAHPARPHHFELVAGERRLRALRLLGRREAPALVRAIPDEHLLEWALVENLQREPLNPIEEAQAYRTLLDRYDYTQESLAHRVGKERSTIANLVRLLALPAPLREDLEVGRLTVGHARALLPVTEADRQLALRELVLARGLSVRETERQVKLEQKRARPTARRRAAGGRGRDPKLLAVEEALEARLGTRVAVRHAPDEKGRIEIEYYSLDDFNRLYDLLMGE